MQIIGLIKMTKCPHDPKETHPAVGMYHCPECGEMVIANMEHPDYNNTINAECKE